MKKKSVLKRKTIIRRSNIERTEYLQPNKADKLFTSTKDYKHFWGHLVKEIAEQLPKKPVICWYDDHTLSLPICAVNKFLREKTCCKRCTLFQKDDHSIELRNLIEKWEIDDLEA